MAANSRIWEDETPPPNQSTRPAQLPSIANITNRLPANGNNSNSVSPTFPQNNRDSDQWASQPQSTRSSAYSSGFTGYSFSSGITSPHRASNSSQLGATSHPAEFCSPTQTSQTSPNYARHHNSLGLPKSNQPIDGSQLRNSHEFPAQESRRSSLGSQMNGGIGNLHINGSSPYNGNHEASQSSLAMNLQRERGIQPNTNGIRNSRASSNLGQPPMSPLSPLPGESRHAYTSRNAPAIGTNPMKEVYNAEKPTAGQPYAFPDPELSHRSSSGTADDVPPQGNMLSRRNSDHTSMTSSIFTSDSRMPPGQHLFDDGKSAVSDTHHHSLQHKQVAYLAQDADSPEGSSPYSRTPALRASHKLAERKRRTEMKFLFDGLRSQIPASHGSKSSKWEILSKASDYIKTLEGQAQAGQQAQKQVNQIGHEFEAMRREMDNLRTENQRLFQEMSLYRQQQQGVNVAPAQQQIPSQSMPPPGVQQQQPALQQPLSNGQQSQQQPPMVHAPLPQHPGPQHFPLPPQSDPSRSLPPLSNGVPASNDMQGVQYS